MSIGRAGAVTLNGLNGTMIGVEAHTASGLPAFKIVGLPDTSLTEARDRVRAAIESCGITFPRMRVTVGLTPADIPKAGSVFDVAIAVAILRAQGLVSARQDAVFVGELGLDGRIHPVRGVLPIVNAAVGAGYTHIYTSAVNAPEACLIPGAEINEVTHLAEVITALGGRADLPPIPESDHLTPSVPPEGPEHDLADLIGQHEARAALEVVAAGGHHMFLTGPPGVGKTMLAERLPGILPDLTPEQAVTVSSVHSISGSLPGNALIERPPFEAPHHSATMSALIGGGSGMPRPGAASRAHMGVLFLDECPEFAPRVLDALRQPLEDGQINIHRSYGTASFPARFQLVLAANPCPCGKGVGKGLGCTCTPQRRRKYQSRLSGPLLDRIDVRVEVGSVTTVDVKPAQSTAEVRERVAAARKRAQARLVNTPWELNAHVPGAWYRTYTAEHAGHVLTMLRSALEYGRMSMRGMDRIVRLSWTLADLAGTDAPEPDHVAVATTLRMGADYDY